MTIHKSSIIYSTVLGCISIFSTSCVDTCESTRTYVYFEPVYITTQEAREGFKIGDPIVLENPGKIYLYGQYVLINEPGKGVHIINNIDKTNPVIEKFISIPGNFDIAVKNNILYADSYVDLLSIDISDLSNIKLINRLESAFPNYNTQFGFSAEDGVVISRWEEIQEIEISNDCRDTGGVIIALGFGVAMDAQASAASGPDTQVGIGGSLARFAVYLDYLYAVDSYSLNIFDITESSTPEFENAVDISWDVETIFPFKDKLFIGAQSGMYIFDVSVPALPEYVSNFLHVTACDPVVANDEFAFVTLRSGNPCQGFTNELDVIDIRNITAPILHKIYPMENPYGLGLDENILFLSEGDFGLKVFDISDVDNITSNLIAHFEDIRAFDVIPWQKVLLAIGADGLYQYDYSDIQNIKLLSFIPVVAPEI